MTSELLALPTSADEWMEFVTTRPDAFLAKAREHVAALKDGTPRTAVETLNLWNEVTWSLKSAGSPSYVLSECHPDPAVRDAGSERYLAAVAFETELMLDRDLFELFTNTLATDEASDLTAEESRLLEHTLRDLRLAGVGLDDAGRARAQELADRDSQLSVEFNKNIRDGKRSMRIAPDALAGLPQDFIDNHPVDDDGLITLTTDYPDYVPVREYATNRDTRVAISKLYNDLAWPANDPILAELLDVRRERAQLLGFGDWSDVETATRMAGSSANVDAFLTRVDDASRDAAATEYGTVLARLQQEVPHATDVTTADLAYLLNTIRREQYDVDAQVVRSYFTFTAVMQGVLDLTGALLGLEYHPVSVPTWHDDVHVFDVAKAGATIGRIYLDMHPRDGKFNHAACFDLVVGRDGVELPEGVLMCNFARGTMEHDEVTTFLHEFGHLVHAILAGHQRFTAQSGIATEWDFVEAPSQMLEEWAWDADVLARFARNTQGEAIPAALVERMREADAFGRALLVRRQLGFARVSYQLHHDVPADITAAAAHWVDTTSPVKNLEGSHFACSFGHLTGYGASYYTYQWSLVIARDLLTAFGDDLMNETVATRYRESVLEPGGTKDAADLVRDFLGREYTFDAYRDWLSGR
ncbi:M3 family metallopeptidase [Microbacterium sp. NC79]|uniref:M3 family metallopeptidase n=1 Tax=Microbacterium sp. NC79 TaxID=2851009 RepID=UPI001C2C94CF|nr:M3 family metallopeptidase [Microbacterium sp. NC79]MBV0896034.1 Zn-dependent oligopeptidase [Microbacterium sp. NC79]